MAIIELICPNLLRWDFRTGYMSHTAASPAYKATHQHCAHTAIEGKTQSSVLS